MKINKKWVAFFIGLAIFTICPNQVFGQVQERLKVAILPVKIHAPENMEYLQAGLMDMLASRLGGKAEVELLDRKQVAKTFKKFKKDLNATTAKSLAEELGADYLVSGSVTFFGTGGSIDFKVFSPNVAKPPFTSYSLIQDMNNLLPKFSQVVDEINAKAFAPRSRLAVVAPPPPVQKPQAAQAAPAITPEPAAPDQRVQQQPPPVPVPTETAPSQPKMASIKQELVQEKPISTYIGKPAMPETTVAPQPNPWQSQQLDQAVLSMDVGDLFGDGSKELVGMSRKKILVYRHSAEGLKELAKYRGGKRERFVWVSVADINRNGRDEIYVTSQRKIGASKIKLSSFVLEWDGKQLSALTQNLDYYLRAVRVPGEPARLFGQKSAEDGSFLPEMYELGWQNNQLTPVSAVSAPESVDIFNASMGNIIGQGRTETIMITSKGYLLLLDGHGQPYWKSYDHFGSSENYIELELAPKDIPQPVDDIENEGYRFTPAQIESPDVKRLYLSSPILLRDLDRDGKLEVVVTRNLPGLAQLGGGRDYSKSEILSLSWGGNGMLENWKTAEIKGVISSLQIADLNGDGTEELIVSAMRGGGITSLWRSWKTVIIGYALQPK